MRLLLTLTLIICVHLAKSQVTDLTLINGQGVETGNEIDWIACNENESFYKSDTIVFSEYSTENCNNYVSIKFRNKQPFGFGEHQGDSEPPSKTLFRKPTICKITQTKTDSYFELTIFQQNTKKTIYKYKIIELKQKTKQQPAFKMLYSVMRLVRVK